MDAEEKKLQGYADWKPVRMGAEEERALLDGIRRRNDERKRAEGVLPQKIGDVKKQMDGMLPASDPETVNLMPSYFRERTSEEQAEYDQYKADRADFDRWTKTSPIAKPLFRSPRLYQLILYLISSPLIEIRLFRERQAALRNRTCLRPSVEISPVSFILIVLRLFF